MFVSARRRTAMPQRGLGTWYDPSTWYTLPASWFVNEDELGKAAVRAHGINPDTGKLTAPQYAVSVQKNDGVDPNNPTALSALAKKIYTDAIAKFKSDYQNAVDDSNKKAFPWSLVGIGVVVVGGIYLGGKALAK
jgi:hypothetical protein